MRCFQWKVTGFRAVAVGMAPCVLLLALGCGSRSTEGSSGAGTRAAGSGQFELDLANCAGFGPAQAASILGVPAEKFQAQAQDYSEGSRWCMLANSDDSAKNVIFILGRAKTLDEAVLEFAQFRGHVDVAVGTLAKEGQKAHEIPGLGDEALWTPIPGGVYLRKGRYSVQVNDPADEEAQIKIARKILGE